MKNSNCYDVEFPPLPRATVSGARSRASVETQIRALRLVHTKSTKTVGALRHRNSLLPFYQLPPEIRLPILCLALSGGYNGDDYYRRLYNFAQVSYLWWSLVLNSPTLWTKVCCRMNSQIRGIALVRSKNCPLDIIGVAGPYGSCGPFAAFIRDVAANAERWGSLDLSLDFQAKTSNAKRILERPMPNLRSATLKHHFHTPLNLVINLGVGQAGFLEDLSLEAVCVPWDSTILLGLKSFRLSGITISGKSPRWSQLDNLLRNAGSLESLGLKSVHFLGLYAIKGDLEPVHLPLLRDITLEDVHPHLFRNISETFHLPSLEVLGSSMDLENGSFDDVFTPATNHMLPIFSAILDLSETVHISLSHGECSVRGCSFTIRLSNEAHPYEFAKWVAKLQIGKESPEGIELHLGPYEPVHDVGPAIGMPPNVLNIGSEPLRQLTTDTWDAIRSAVDYLPNTSELRLELGSVFIDPLLQHLTYPRTQRNATEEWPLPRLQYLEIHQEQFTFECLRTMWHHRYEGNGVDSMNRPRSLDGFVILSDYGTDGSLSEGIRREIAEIVGPDKFFC